jgi:hypothetical protein
MRNFGRLVAALAFAVLTSCGPSNNDEPRAVRSSVPPSVVSGDDAVCDRFFAIVGDFRMSDEQSAVAFADLARDAEDPALRAAIRRVGEGFAAHDPAVSSTEVQRLC